MKIKEIKKMQVVFSFGSIATVSVNIYEGKTLNECVRLRSEKIDGYILNGKYVAIAQNKQSLEGQGGQDENKIFYEQAK